MMFDWLIEKIVSAEKQNRLRHRLVLAGVLTVSMTVTMMPVASLAETMSNIQGGGVLRAEPVDIYTQRNAGSM